MYMVFPNKHYNDTTIYKTLCEKAVYKNQRCKHHEMVPVKDPTGCTAAILYKPYTKWTPHKNTNQITYIKTYRY